MVTPDSSTPLVARLRGVAARARSTLSGGVTADARLRALERKVAKQGRRDRLDDAHVRAGRLDYPHAEIFLRLGSFSEFERLQSCAKEPWTVAWIEKWIEPGETLYDVGANVGAYSLVAAKAPGSGARVVAIEPGYATYAALSDNIVLNAAGDLVTALPVALGARTSLEALHLRDLAAGAAMHDFGGDALDDGRHVYHQPVITMALDELIERFGLPPATHIKLDVDGTELDVIAGAAATLRSSALRSVLVEMDAGMEQPIADALSRQGLVQRERHQRDKPGPDKPPAYGLFTPEADSR